MSKNAATKRRQKARHRDQFSRVPLGVDYALFLPPIVPASTPLFDELVRSAPLTKAMVDAAMLEVMWTEGTADHFKGGLQGVMRRG